MSESVEQAAPFRAVVQHRGADDRLACGHTVSAHGLVAKKRRCPKCAAARMAERV